MIVYKAVRRNGSAFKSAIVDTVGLCLNYQIGHTTVAPEGTKLLVFKDLCHAEQWALNRDCVVLECDAPDKLDSIVYLADLSWSIRDILKFWGKMIASYCNTPYGTYGATYVTPVRKASGW